MSDRTIKHQTPEEVRRFEVYWNYKAGKFDTAIEYKASFREPRGFFRGAKIRQSA